MSINAYPTGNATEVTVATLAKEGTPITGASMPTGGASVTGWLSAIWKAFTDRFPTAATLSDTLSNPSATIAGACGLYWDPAASQWVRKTSHYARNVIASNLYNPGAGLATQTSAQVNRTGTTCFAQIHVPDGGAGTGTLALRLIICAGGGRWIVANLVVATTTGTKSLMFGPGCTGNGTGGSSFIDSFAAGCLPRDWYIDVVHSASSAWTYSVDADTF